MNRCNNKKKYSSSEISTPLSQDLTHPVVPSKKHFCLISVPLGRTFQAGTASTVSEPLNIRACLHTAALLQTLTRKQALCFEAAAKKKLLLPSLPQRELRLAPSPSGRCEIQQQVGWRETPTEDDRRQTVAS